MADPDGVIAAAEKVSDILAAEGVDALVIGAIALAAHGYVRIVPLPHLVALKLYAGGAKSRADIVELLSRNPEVDTAAIRTLCRGWRLGGLDPLIDEAARS
jgi:hypothetical protein